jgi:CBS-domain-containing membrane protein
VSSSATLGGRSGLCGGFICHAAMSPADSATQGPPASRVLAAMLAITGTMAGQRLLRAMHPPGAATTLLIAFGSFSVTSRDLTAIAAGVLLVCLIGEGVRLLRRRLGKRLGWPE